MPKEMSRGDPSAANSVPQVNAVGALAEAAGAATSVQRRCHLATEPLMCHFIFCPDRRGMGHGVNGGFARYMVVRQNQSYRIPAGLSLRKGGAQ
jgi:D-arabinose 1-dehydrogenase-like Zn-dependent alcohol dehydrogenase